MKNLQREARSEKREEGYKNLLIWSKSILRKYLFDYLKKKSR